MTSLDCKDIMNAGQYPTYFPYLPLKSGNGLYLSDSSATHTHTLLCVAVIFSTISLSVYSAVYLFTDIFANLSMQPLSINKEFGIFN